MINTNNMRHLVLLTNTPYHKMNTVANFRLAFPKKLVKFYLKDSFNFEESHK